jgi:hypothetical protein
MVRLDVSTTQQDARYEDGISCEAHDCVFFLRLLVFAISLVNIQYSPPHLILETASLSASSLPSACNTFPYIIYGYIFILALNPAGQAVVWDIYCCYTRWLCWRDPRLGKTDRLPPIHLLHRPLVHLIINKDTAMTGMYRICSAPAFRTYPGYFILMSCCFSKLIMRKSGWISRQSDYRLGNQPPRADAGMRLTQFPLQWVQGTHFSQ